MLDKAIRHCLAPLLRAESFPVGAARSIACKNSSAHEYRRSRSLAKALATISFHCADKRGPTLQSAQSGVTNADDTFQIRPLTLTDREILRVMYRTFEPLGGAQGLPPRVEEARQAWIDRVLQQKFNIGAFSASGDLAGHSFLALSDAGDAELAIFVHQQSRQRGVGMALLKAVVKSAEQLGLRRIRAETRYDNIAKLHLLKRCGFRSVQSTYGAEVLVLDLLAPVFTDKFSDQQPSRRRAESAHTFFRTQPETAQKQLPLGACLSSGARLDRQSHLGPFDRRR